MKKIICKETCGKETSNTDFPYQKFEQVQENIMIYEMILLEVVLALDCYSGDKKNKIRTSFKSYIAKKARTRRVTINFNKKLCLAVITQNKKHLSKQVVPVTCTLEKKFFCSCYFRGFLSNFISGRVKKCSVLWFVRVTLGFSEKRRPRTYCL